MAFIDFSKEKYDIIIQAGQSNSNGTSYGDADEPYNVDENVWYMVSLDNNRQYIEVAREEVDFNFARSNYSLMFCQRYREAGMLEEGRKILILRTSVGGTGFLDNRWNMTGDLYLRMMEMIQIALGLNPENRLVALLWHQGETDASFHATYDVHYKHLMDMLTSVRETFSVPDLPFVAGDFVQHWKGMNLEISEPIIAAIRGVCNDAGNAAFVETDGLISNDLDKRNPGYGCGDSIHFCRNDIYKLGERYFDAFRSIVNG